MELQLIVIPGMCLLIVGLVGLGKVVFQPEQFYQQEVLQTVMAFLLGAIAFFLLYIAAKLPF